MLKRCDLSSDGSYSDDGNSSGYSYYSDDAYSVSSDSSTSSCHSDEGDRNLALARKELYLGCNRFTKFHPDSASNPSVLLFSQAYQGCSSCQDPATSQASLRRMGRWDDPKRRHEIQDMIQWSMVSKKVNQYFSTLLLQVFPGSSRTCRCRLPWCQIAIWLHLAPA